jgi:hypothetical protein
MHYKKLIKAHKLFYEEERRAFRYDEYMKNKNWKGWKFSSISKDEIRTLFDFIHKWDGHFQGNEERFQRIYKNIYPVIKELEYEKIESSDFTSDKLKLKIREVFDKIADCTRVVTEKGAPRYESTDASKMLHTILPNFFVMWDGNIREGIVGRGQNGLVYAFSFLPEMQRELKEAIKTCEEGRKMSYEDAIDYICNRCDKKALAKLADEYNYMIYTKHHRELKDA